MFIECSFTQKKFEYIALYLFLINTVNKTANSTGFEIDI